MTREEIIIEMQPFSMELKKWCKANPEFSKALKITNFERFITLQVVATSYSPHYPDDEVIGFYALDYGMKKLTFKQDFIVNLGKKNQEFVLYTRYSNATNKKYIRDINEFFTTYGKGGYYVGSHWVSLEQLPPEVSLRADKAILLAERLKESGLRYLSNESLMEIYLQIRELRKKGEIK